MTTTLLAAIVLTGLQTTILGLVISYIKGISKLEAMIIAVSGMIVFSPIFV